MWHFRWHLSHLDVTPHDINSNWAARIDIVVLFWEERGELTSWSLLHILYCPEERGEIMSLLPRDMCRWGCHICVMYCKEALGLLTEQRLLGRGSGHTAGYHSLLYSFCSSNCFSDCLAVLEQPCIRKVIVNSGCRLRSFSWVARL